MDFEFDLVVELVMRAFWETRDTKYGTSTFGRSIDCRIMDAALYLIKKKEQGKGRLIGLE